MCSTQLITNKNLKFPTTYTFEINKSLRNPKNVSLQIHIRKIAKKNKIKQIDSMIIFPVNSNYLLKCQYDNKIKNRIHY